MPPRRTTALAPASNRHSLPNELIDQIIREAAHLAALDEDGYHSSEESYPSSEYSAPNFGMSWEPSSGRYWSERARALMTLSQVSRTWRGMAQKELVAHLRLKKRQEVKKSLKLLQSKAGRDRVCAVRTVWVAGEEYTGVDPLGVEDLAKTSSKSLQELSVSTVGLLRVPNPLSCEVLSHFDAKRTYMLGPETKRLPSRPYPLQRLTLDNCIMTLNALTPSLFPNLRTLSLSNLDVSRDSLTAMSEFLLGVAPRLTVFEYDFCRPDVLPPPAAFTSLQHFFASDSRINRFILNQFHGHEALDFINNLDTSLQTLSLSLGGVFLKDFFASGFADSKSSISQLRDVYVKLPSITGIIINDFMEVRAMCQKRGIEVDRLKDMPFDHRLGRHMMRVDLAHADSIRTESI